MNRSIIFYFFFACITLSLQSFTHIIDNRTNGHIGGSFTYKTIKLDELPRKKPFSVPPHSKKTIEGGCVESMYVRGLSGPIKGLSEISKIPANECLCSTCTFIVTSKNKKLYIDREKIEKGE